MLTLNQSQIQKLSLACISIFVRRVVTELQTSHPAWYQKMGDAAALEYVSSQLDVARELHITIELDVFEFIVLTVQFGKEFYLDPRCSVEVEWLKSEYVPGSSKITKLKSAANKLNKTRG